MSEQNKILAKHNLQDTFGAGAHGPVLDSPVSNLHSRVTAAAFDIGQLRERIATGQPEQDYEIVDEPDQGLKRDPRRDPTSVMEEELPRQRERNRVLGEALDNWQHRSQHMRCETCMWFVPKRGAMEENTTAEMEQGVRIGRCRQSSPTMKGWPAMFPTDWCGDHKLDETKL